MNENDFQTLLRELFSCEDGDDDEISVFCGKVLSSLLNDDDLLSHSKKVAYYSMAIFNHVRPIFNLSDSDRRTMFLAALLHDVGKLDVRREILYKKTALTDQEYEEMKMHPTHSTRVLSHFQFLQPVLDIIRYHHEHFDGNGYPDRLRGDKIPVLSRIISVADAFDAMTSIRPYKSAKSMDWAVQELIMHSGTQFDPVITQGMIDLCKLDRISVGWEF